MLVRFSDIVWDVDSGELNPTTTACVLDVSDEAVDQLAEYGADLLSDKFGWCVRSFQFAPCFQVQLGGCTVTVVKEGAFLYLYPEGYGEPEAEDGCGSPVFLEVAGGRLRVVVSPDIRDAGKRVLIDLEGAREVLR